MTLAKKAASIAARSTVRARSIHRSRSFNSAWRAWRVVIMPKGEYAGVWRGVSGSFHSDGVSRSRGRPPDSYAWSALSSVSARATSESTFRCSSTPASPAPIVSTAAWVAPTVRQLSATETNPFNSPAQFSLGSKRLWRDHARPRSRPARQRARPSRIPRPGRSCGNPWPPTPTMVRFE